MNEVKMLPQPYESIASISDLVAGTTPSNLAHPVTPSNERLQMDILSRILCPAPLETAKSLDLIYFGHTSAFARLASSVGRSIPLLKETATPVSRPARLLENLCGSLILNVSAEISQAEAQNLAWNYYRSIEIIYPILGLDLVNQTVEDVYNGRPMAEDDDNVVRTRFNLILAISLALMSVHDLRLQVFADAYFRKATSCGLSYDHFVYPTTQSLQIILMMCIYAWIRPTAMDLWRLLGHASRMCLDVVEVQGSDKTQSAYAGVLYRTLYTLETHISVYFGRPHQLPDREDVPTYLPDPSSVAAGELSTMIYNLARLQSRFQRDVSRSDPVSPGHEFADSALHNTSWMAAGVRDTKIWLEDWNTRLDTLFDGSSAPEGGDDLKLHLRRYGEFQQCEVLLLAKIATERRGQSLIPSKDEKAVSKQLLQAVYSLHKGSGLPTEPLSPHALGFIFPLTWTRAHAMFSAMTVLLQHMSLNSVPDSETEHWFKTGLDMLVSFEPIIDWGLTGLVHCMQNLYKSTRL